MELSDPLHALPALNPAQKLHGTHGIGDWVCFGVGPGDLEKRKSGDQQRIEIWATSR